MGAPKVTKEAIERAMKAVAGTGFEIGAVEVNNVDGTIRIERRDVTNLVESVDDLKDDVPPSGPKKWGNKG